MAKSGLTVIVWRLSHGRGLERTCHCHRRTELRKLPHGGAASADMV